MGNCIGYLGWKKPTKDEKTGDNAMFREDDEAGEVIWPIKKPVDSERQFLVYKGDRSDRDPALLTCAGKCGSKQVKWTWHEVVNNPTYRCLDCGTHRKWGFGLGYRF